MELKEKERTLIQDLQTQEQSCVDSLYSPFVSVWKSMPTYPVVLFRHAIATTRRAKTTSQR